MMRRLGAGGAESTRAGCPQAPAVRAARHGRRRRRMAYGQAGRPPLV